MNTLINEVTQAGRFGAPTGNEVHWTFNWYQPLKPDTGTNSNSNGSVDSNNNIPSANNFLLGSKEHNGSRTNLNRSSSNLFQLENGRTESNVTQQNNGDDDTVERYPFKVKTWLKTQQNDYATLDLEENNTLKVLDLNLFDRTKISTDKDQTKIALEKNKRVDGDGLTEKDIRGAVAGSGSIPGLSSNDNQNNASTEKKNTTETTTEPTTETTTEPTTETTTTPPKQNLSALEANNEVATEIPVNEDSTLHNAESSKETEVLTQEPSVTATEPSTASSGEESSVEPPVESSVEPSVMSSVEPSVEVSQSNNETPVESTTETPSNVDNEGDIEMKE
ncbi:hypothetical protein C6P44_004415 [Monosporozyma unispora]|nr:hypothetical protein C6P44_004415 [Kazachstania unispora]